jgi:DNA-directed RNA polymerase specialized sigma24 family protein
VSAYFKEVPRRDAKEFAEDPALMSMGGLESELEDLYRRRNGAFQMMLASVTGSVESARDVVQEAFARALRDQNGFRGEGSLETWVWRIAFRVAIGSKGSRELVVDEVPEIPGTSVDPGPPAKGPVRNAIFIGFEPYLPHGEWECLPCR